MNEFLSAGRPSTSSWTSGHGSLPPSSSTNPVPPTTAATIPSSTEESSRPSTSDSLAKPKQSPRRIVVPRIDVSNSQRWPAAQPIGLPEHQGPSDFLKPGYHSRSQSASSLQKRKGRGRGLSVTFIEAPPVIIGEGGDEALVPPVEISKARARARSFSPMTSRSQQPTATAGQASAYPQQGTATRHDPPDILRPRGLQRVQTGMPPASSVSPFDKEFAMTLRPGPTVSPDTKSPSPHTPEIIAPKPMRPVRPPPLVSQVPEPTVARKPVPKDEWREGDMLRLHHESDVSEFGDDVSPGGASSRGTSIEEHQPSQWI